MLNLLRALVSFVLQDCWLQLLYFSCTGKKRKETPRIKEEKFEYTLSSCFQNREKKREIALLPSKECPKRLRTRIHPCPQMAVQPHIFRNTAHMILPFWNWVQCSIVCVSSCRHDYALVGSSSPSESTVLVTNLGTRIKGVIWRKIKLNK